MNHDQETGLMHFSGEELGVINEPRSPIDERAAPLLLRKVCMLADDVASELDMTYRTKTHEVALIGGKITGLRGRSSLLEQVRVELTSVAAEVELKDLLHTR